MPEDIVSSDQIDDWLSTLGDEGIEVVDAGGAGARSRSDDARERRRCPRSSRKTTKRPPPRADEEGRERGGRGLRRRLLEDQRPGAHVPAQDGLGLAAHPRGRGRDRQAHRGGRAARAPGRAQLARSPSRRSSSSATSCKQAEDPRQGGRQGRRRGGRRVRRGSGTSSASCKIIDKVRRLAAREREASTRSSTARRLRGDTQEEAQGADRREQAGDVRAALGAAHQQEADRQDRPEAQGAGRRASRRPSTRSRELRAASRAVAARSCARRCARCASSPQRAARDRQEARPHAPRSSRRWREIIADAQQEDQARRGGGQAHRGRRCATPTTTSTTASGWPSGQGASWSRPTCAWWSRSPRSTPTAACSSST